MSSLGLEILSLKEILFKVDKDALIKLKDDFDILKIDQTFNIETIKNAKDKVGISYTLQAFVKLNQKNKLLFEFNAYFLFQIESVEKIKRKKGKIIEIDQDLLRLLASVCVGTSRGILSQKSNSLPPNFILPIIDFEELNNNMT
ncbi:hypothetical protein [Ulvibacter antarcticus]|uniref:Preprotein translocase subunit SecB n=1 Tax=Ulvibacter antarcticus TaxID=442714 RepID=A0A3L9Y7G4_9FLAO|nr:hypothetical protein [Ulvibacter antarcticus]RMA56656.1 hypothetical protein BXY75_3359 [Ulvibacter antarcticus]